MIIASNELPGQAPLEATVCIIGAGAAGITLACELDSAGFSVLLLEAGGRGTPGANAEYYRGTASAPHPATTDYRRVRFGGTTGVWGGRCVPFDPIDFERREYITDSGWPIPYAEVARYYPRALAYCDAGEFDFSISGSLPGAPPTIAGFDGAGVVLDNCIERYSLPTDFGKRYRATIDKSANVTSILHARCVALHRAAGANRIERAEFVDRGGRRRCVNARYFVLACGGIEVPRLLLASDGNGAGLGNASDHVGRYYACHIENALGKLTPNGAAVAFDFERTADGVYCRRKFQFSDAAQREHQLLNTAIRLHFPDYADASHGSSVLSAIYLTKSALLPEYRAILQHNSQSAASPVAAHGGNVLRGLPDLARFAWLWLRHRQLARRKLPYTLVANADGSYPLEFNCEQTPQSTNRITLTPDLDMHGMRRVHVEWRIAEADVAASCRALELLRAVVNRTGTARVEYGMADVAERIRRSAPLGGHHLGTARMAVNARAGVVDGDCALFELPNLLVASSAVFPTASHANPTLTIVALAVRLAEFIKARCGALNTAEV